MAFPIASTKDPRHKEAKYLLYFESKHLEKNKTSGTYLPNRGSII